MDTCPFFGIERLSFHSDEKRRDQQVIAHTVVNVPWCAHERSPAPKRFVTTVAGGAHVLRCGGNLDQMSGTAGAARRAMMPIASARR